MHHGNRPQAQEFAPDLGHQDASVAGESDLAAGQESAHKKDEEESGGDAAQRKADVFTEGEILHRVAWEKEGETWKRVRLLSCADFDTEITFNPNKV